MKKQEHSSLYKALGVVGVLLAAVLIPFFLAHPARHYADPLERALSLYQKGDYKQAATYFRQADSMGSADAAFALGAMSFAGKGTAVNIPEALLYYEKAARSGYTPAQTTLALIYIHGQNVAQDLEKGLDYAKQAAGNGDVDLSHPQRLEEGGIDMGVDLLVVDNQDPQSLCPVRLAHAL